MLWSKFHLRLVLCFKVAAAGQLVVTLFHEFCYLHMQQMTHHLGCIKSASVFKKRLGKALSCHLTKRSKESAYIIIFDDFISKSFVNKYRQWRRLSVIHTCRSYVHPQHADFGLLREKSSPKWEIPCPGCSWTTVQNWTLLALPSLGKSVTVQTKTNEQTVNDISTLCLSACVDNKHFN